MSVFKPIDSERIVKYRARSTNYISSSDSGALFYYAPSGSISSYKESYASHSSWYSIKNLFYDPLSEQYIGQNKDGFYSSSLSRICIIPFHNSGDRIKRGSLTLYDYDTDITLTDNASGNLFDNRFSDMIVGNVFYEAGVVVIWEDEESIYRHFATGSNWGIQLTSEIDIIRKEWSLTIDKNELNYSQNPSSVTNYTYLKTGLGAIESSLRAEYNYSSSFTQRSKTRDQCTNFNHTYSLEEIGSPRIEYFDNYGLYFSSCSQATCSAYVREGSIFSTESIIHDGAYLIVLQGTFKDLPTASSDEKNCFHFVSYRTSDQGYVCSLSGSQPTLSIHTDPFNGDAATTYFTSSVYSSSEQFKQLAFYIDFNDQKGYQSHSVFINGTESIISASYSGANTCSFYWSHSADTYLYGRSDNITGSEIPTTSSIFSGSIAYIRFYELSGYLRPSYDNLKTYLNQQFKSGSYNIASGSGEYKINPNDHKPPFISEFGLYNDRNELLVVGKLGQPIPNDPDVPIMIKATLDIL